MFEAHPTFGYLLAAWAFAAFGAWFALMLIPAPYGRLVRAGWGPGVRPAFAWFFMESPGAIIFAAVLLASLPVRLVPALFGVLWLAHYAYRGFLYPLLNRSTRAVPLAIVLLAVGFHAANATLQAWEIYRIHPDRPASWLADPRFVAGLVLFVAGFATAAGADARLRALRQTAGQEYRIPRGGMFERVSCPNYLGEIVEWTGWALLTGTWSGFVFALWTVANLLPRALALHRWYRREFPDYPADRQALIPYVL